MFSFTFNKVTIIWLDVWHYVVKAHQLPELQSPNSCEGPLQAQDHFHSLCYTTSTNPGGLSPNLQHYDIKAKPHRLCLLQVNSTRRLDETTTQVFFWSRSLFWCTHLRIVGNPLLSYLITRWCLCVVLPSGMQTF